jgi:hypothetical protein
MKKYIDTNFPKEQNKLLKVALKYENGYNRKVFKDLPMDIVEYEEDTTSILFSTYFINIPTMYLYVNTPTQREDGSHINADTQKNILGGYNNATAAHVKSLFMDVVDDKNIMIAAIAPEDGDYTVYVNNSLLEIFTQGQPGSEYELRTTSASSLVYVMYDGACIGGLLPIRYNKK